MFIVPPATYDRVCHCLQCPRCGQVAEDPCSIEMQTKIARVPAMRDLRVGDSIELTDDFLAAGYLQNYSPENNASVTVLETWSCPNCGTNFLWAVLRVEESVLQAIEPIQLTEAALFEINFLTGQVLFLFPMEETLAVKQLSAQKFREALVQAEQERQRYLDEQFLDSN